jgi:hypothetical protein
MCALQLARCVLVDIFVAYGANIIHIKCMGSVLSFVAEYFLNWKIYLFVLIQTLGTYFMDKTMLSKLILLFFTILTSCPISAWYSMNDVKLKITMFIILMYSIYTGIVPFNYPRKKYSYIVFQYLANLVIFYIVFMFFELYFCRNFADGDTVLPAFFTR